MCPCMIKVRKTKTAQSHQIIKAWNNWCPFEANLVSEITMNLNKYPSKKKNCVKKVCQIENRFVKMSLGTFSVNYVYVL